MFYGLVRTRYNWNFSKTLILSGQTIDFYMLDIAHVLLFTLTVFLFRLALPLWAWLYILTNVQCVLLWILSFLIMHIPFHNEMKMFVSGVTL